MKEIVTFVLLAALLAAAFKIAIVLLILAGLLFRTKETVGLIAILAVVAGFNAHPGIGIGLIVVTALILLYFKSKEASVSGADADD